MFNDGSPARFWGTNLTASALFGTTKERTREQAHRLSELGFNLVRIHHQDSDWVRPNIFGDGNSASTQSLDTEMLDRLDWWIKCLKDEGIYVWLDLHVGRRLKAADGVYGFDEIRGDGQTAPMNGYNFVNDSIVTVMQRFNNQYLTHKNAYTGLRYVDDPALLATLISNENDLTHHFGNSLLPDKNVPLHTAIYLRKADAFASAHGLPSRLVWRAWEDGPAKLFLNDLEHRFDSRMISDLRGLGDKSLIATTSSFGSSPLSSLPALTSGDIIDVHSYGGVAELAENPLLTPNIVSWIAAAHVAGMPLSVSEWGVDDRGAPTADRQDMPLYLAAESAMQGARIVMFYAYAQEALNGGPGTASVYQAYNDPAMLPGLAAAALLFRQEHVHEARAVYVFAPSEEALINRGVSAATSVALRTAAERGKLLIELPYMPALAWLRKPAVPMAAKVMTNPVESQFPAGASEITSDDGELRRNWKLGIFTVDTPLTQAAVGKLGGKTITTSEVSLEVLNDDAMVAVQSLDGMPVAQSRQILISFSSRTTLGADNALPYRSEPLQGVVTIKAASDLELYAADAAGKLRKSTAAHLDSSHYVLKLDATSTSNYFILRPRVMHEHR